MSIEKGPLLNCYGNKVSVRILRRPLHFRDPYGPYINNKPENDNVEKWQFSTKSEGYTLCVFTKFGHFSPCHFLMNLNPITPKDRRNTIRV